MNAPAKRFSLQRLLTTPAPAPVAVPPPPPPAVVVAPTPEPAPAPAPTIAALFEPAEATPVLRPLPAPTRLSKPVAEESHPKKKRSYSVDMKLCEDLEILSWYLSRSSSSVVEELIRKHLQHNKSVLLKAREIRNAR
ncbi:MAG TPA: hypothetical protein VNM14_01610 [Planctomycetota bacterium]|jgi:hypothetical protein|nr:hypothetical protein [Planctomycetota bacterium]